MILKNFSKAKVTGKGVSYIRKMHKYQTSTKYQESAKYYLSYHPINKTRVNSM